MRRFLEGLAVVLYMAYVPVVAMLAGAEQTRAAGLPEVKQSADSAYYLLRGDGWCWALPYKPFATGAEYFPADWTRLDDAGKAFHWPDPGPEVTAACAELVYLVAPNGDHPTRPLYDRSFARIGDVPVGTPCASELVKAYSTTIKTLAYRPVAGGVAVCKEQ